MAMALYLCKRKLFSALKLPALSKSTISLYFLTSNASSYHYSTTTLKPQYNLSIPDYLINSHQLSPETASKASSALAHLKSFDNAELIINYLKDFGFSTSHLNNLLKRKPIILSANLDHTIKPKICLLQNFGITTPDIVELFSKDPHLFFRDVDNQLGRSILILKSFLGCKTGVTKLLKVTTDFLRYNLDKTMVPNIELFKSLGVCEEQIQQIIFHFPRFLLYRPEIMKQFVKRVDEMGFRRDSKMFLHAVRVISSMSEESWESKLKVFHRIGFTQEDILATFRRCPLVFAASERKIEEASDVLISAGKPDSKFLVKYPVLLLFSVKKRTIPRIKVIDALEKRSLIEQKPKWVTVLKLSSEKFYAKYVYPHSDVVGNLYTAHQGS